jgi:hypothetical protein
MKALTKFSAIAAIAAMYSCGKHECHNTDTLFDTAASSSAAYKKQLIKHLDKGGSYTYILTKYEEDGNIPFFYIDIHGKDLCAEAVVCVPLPDETADRIIKNKGVGYYGSEIENLDFELNSAKNIFIYRTADDIID